METTEIEILPLEKVIENKLIQNNVTEQVLAELKSRYGGMVLKSLDDKQSYLEISDARKEVRKIGIATEKICKVLREDAIKTQKLVLSKEKEILGRIAQVQDPLDAEIKKYEDEQERIEKEAEKQRETNWINRQSTLSKLGAIYDNGSFVLKHISYELELLKQVDDDQFKDTILPKYKKVFEEVEAERVAEENKRKEEAQKIKEQQDELAEQQRVLKQQQDELKEAQEHIRIQKENVEREERRKQQEMEDATRQERQNRMSSRINYIGQLGLRGNRGNYYYDGLDVIVLADDIQNLDEEGWNKLIQNLIPEVEQENKKREEKRIADLEQQRKADIQKALDDEAERKRVAEQKRTEDLQAAKDKEKYADLVGYLKAAPLHAMSSPTYKGKLRVIADFISDLTA